MTGSTRELPLPCSHSHKRWVHRISTHTDEETDAARAGGGFETDRPFCSVWVCADDLEAGKRYVAYYGQCAPHVLTQREAVQP